MSREERIIYRVQLQQITSAIKSVCPVASVIPFGSFQTGISLPNGSFLFSPLFPGTFCSQIYFSDLDVVVVTDRVQRHEDQYQLLKDIAQRISKENVAERSSINIIPKSSLIKFRTLNGMSIHTSLLFSPYAYTQDISLSMSASTKQVDQTHFRWSSTG